MVNAPTFLVNFDSCDSVSSGNSFFLFFSGLSDDSGNFVILVNLVITVGVEVIMLGQPE